MTDHTSPAKLTDAELAVHPTVFAPDAVKGQVVMVSGGAGGIAHSIAARSGVIGLSRAPPPANSSPAKR